MSKFTHYYKFEEFNDSVALVIDYRITPFEPQTHEEPGCPEGAEINSIQLNINGALVSLGALTEGFFDEILIEACLENERGGE